MKLSLKITAYILFVLCFLIGLLLFLNAFKFQTLLAQVTTSRLSAINLSIGNSLEAGVNLGLSLAELTSAQDVIERARDQDPEIALLAVFDAGGTILFATDPERIGERIDPAWAAGQAQSTEALWEVTDDRHFVSGVRLVNSFGQVIGGTALVYPRVHYDGQVAEMVGALSRVAGIILAASGGLALAGVLLLFRGLRRTLAATAEALGMPVRAGPAQPADEVAGELQALGRAFESGVAEALAEIGRVESGIERGLRPAEAAP